MFGLSPLRRNYDAALRDLRASKPAVRASAARDLGMVGDVQPRAAADALAPLVDDTFSEVRSAALTALGVLRARHLADRVATRLDDGDSDVRQLAAVALAEMGGERALELLKQSLESDHADVRFQCLLGVLSLDAREGFAVAVASLASDDPWIAAEAAEQVGRLFALDPDHRTENALDDDARARALAALRAELDDPSQRVAVSAAMALARMGDDGVVPLLCDFVRGRRRVEGADTEALTAEALELLGAVTGDAAAPAREALAVVAWRVIPSPERNIARAALARLGDPRACDDLIEQLRSLLPGRREAAVKLVRVARLQGAEGALLSLLDDGGVEPAFVIDALGAVGGERTRNTLSRVARTHDKSEIRDAARRALSRLEATP
jgi:HEAT repeat protein